MKYVIAAICAMFFVTSATAQKERTNSQFQVHLAPAIGVRSQVIYAHGYSQAAFGAYIGGDVFLSPAYGKFGLDIAINWAPIMFGGHSHFTTNTAGNLSGIIGISIRKENPTTHNKFIYGLGVAYGNSYFNNTYEEESDMDFNIGYGGYVKVGYELADLKSGNNLIMEARLDATSLLMHDRWVPGLNIGIVYLLNSGKAKF